MNKIELLGITLTDYTYRDAVGYAEKSLQSGALNTIMSVTMKMLLAAGEDEKQKEWLESIDLPVCCEVEIFKAASLLSHARMKEVEDNAFIWEFLRRVARQKKTVFLVAETEEALEAYEKELLEYQPMLQIVGGFVLEEDASADKLVNEINDKVPCVVLSKISFPRQLQIMYEYKMAMNAEVWFGMLSDGSDMKARTSGFARWKEWVAKKAFWHRVSSYENEKTDN